jgi:microcystin-dependent protein
MGGEEEHKMTVAELVPHDHTSTFWVSSVRAGGTGNYWNVLQSASNWDSGGAGGPFTTVGQASGNTGQGQPFNVMMPWVALAYCQKS